MIAIKGQSVRLAPATNAALGSRADHGVAKVLAFVYIELVPEGERGVRLDRELAGHCWWSEVHLEAAE